MTSAKAQTNRKWTSSKEFRSNHDRIFTKKTIDQVATKLNPFTPRSAYEAGPLKPQAIIGSDSTIYTDWDGRLYKAWQEGFLAGAWAENPYIPSPSEEGLAWENGRAVRVQYEEP